MGTVKRITCEQHFHRKKLGGLGNSLINKLSFELHFPGGTQYRGPGTKLDKW